MGVEVRGGARNSWTRLLLEHGAEIPAYPGVAIIKPARIPPPPLLSGGDPEQWALQLLRAYTAAAAPGRMLVRLADLQGLAARPRRVLLQAGPVLRAQQTQPLPWCKFSVASWRRYGPPHLRARRPPLQWVYGQARLTRMDLWYQWSGAVTDGSRLVFSATHKALIKRYDRMRRALLVEAAHKILTAHDVKHIVATTLPWDWYRRAVESAQLESEMTQIDIDAGLRRGFDLWG